MKDAHEFLCQVLDQLKDDVDRLNNKRDDEDKEDNETDATLTSNSRGNFLSESNETEKKLNAEISSKIDKIENPIVDNFQFEVTHAIECKKYIYLFNQKREHFTKQIFATVF